MAAAKVTVALFCLFALATLLAVWPLLGTVASADAGGDPDRGEDVYAHRCLVCHATTPEFHKEGPSLSGVYGRRAGTAPFFPHYKGLKGSDIVWSDDALDQWLADPRGFLGGRYTTMTLRMADAQERADVIAYLRTLK